MARSASVLLLVLLAAHGPAAFGRAALHAQPAPPAPGASDDPARIARVERGLLRSIAVLGRPDTGAALAARMRRYGVPAVSIAVLDAGRLAWARAYGVRTAGEPAPVDTATLFQAGSVSKAVTAVAALRLVERGVLRLDEDVNRRLVSWRVPPSAFTAREPVTLRRLLSHTAGLTVPGFSPGYRPGAPLPTVVQVLDGVAPATNPPVRVVAVPGTAWAYSGGGTTVVQQLVTDVTGVAFADLLQREVLAPAGMVHSAFEQPLGAARGARAAIGHSPADTPLANRWPVHPELAAAGLWATPSDLARFALAVQRAWQGAPRGLLAPATARQMLAPGLGSWGIGFATGIAGGGAGDSLTVGHDGSTAGYTCRLVLLPATGQGVVVMTNGESEALIGEVIRSVAREYGWPVRPRPVRRVAAVDAAGYAALAGRYRVDLGARTVDLVVAADSGRLFLTGSSGRPAELLPLSALAYFSPESGNEVTFAPGADGRIGRVTLDQAGQRFVAARVR